MAGQIELIANDELMRSIPHFGLYGEASVEPEHEFVHIETIAARSTDNDWHISPHRHSALFQILLVENKSFETSLDDQQYTLPARCTVTVPAGTVHSFTFKPDTRGLILSVSDNLFRGRNPHGSRESLESVVQAAQIARFGKDNALFRQVRNCMSRLHAEFQNQSIGTELMLQSWTCIVLMSIKRQLVDQHREKPHRHSTNAMLENFRRLVEENFDRHLTVDQYASALHTSVSSLNRCCREPLNQTAKLAIQNRLLVESKRRLIYTSKTIDNIATDLGFKDPAYFSRFFKKLTGYPPGVFRRSTQ